MEEARGQKPDPVLNVWMPRWGTWRENCLEQRVSWPEPSVRSVVPVNYDNLYILVFITEQLKIIIIIGRRHDRVLQSCLRYQGSCRVQHQDSGRTQGQSPACCQKHPWGNQGNEERLHHERWQIYWYSQEDLWPHVSYSLLGSFYSILSSSFSQLQFLQILGCDEWRTSVAGESWPHLRPQLSASTTTSAPDTTTANDPATVGQTDTKHDGSSIRQYVSR